MITDPTYYDLIMSDALDPEAITEYVYNFMNSLPSLYYAIVLISTAFMIVTAILYCKLFEKRKPYTLGFTARGCLPEYLMGIGIGAVMISLPLIVCIATNSVTLTLMPNVSYPMVALFFVAFLIQGMAEEAIFRGYLMTSLARKIKIWPAILISALFFSLFHLGNASFNLIAFLNIFLFGVFAGVFMLKRGSIWAVGAIHAIWNFCQGNVFGMNVSGLVKFDSIFTSTQSNVGAILHGGDFGLEGGLGVTVVLLIALLGALLMPTKKSEHIEESPDNTPETANI
jgi:membrane protease YdiL (CAAX protease family)